MSHGAVVCACRKQGIALVERVPVAIVVERDDVGDGVGAHRALHSRRVDVVAEEDDEVEILIGGEVAPRGVVAVAVVLTRREPEPQPFGRRVRAGKGAGARDRRFPVAERESVPVRAIAPQAFDDGVHGSDRCRGR